MQVMGQVARELGFSGRFLSELADPQVGLEYGCRKFQRCLKATATIEEALLRYNGGNDPTYPAQVKQFIQKYAGVAQ
jgi:soluble lytic murein transglycosylase-like protein